LEPEEEEADLNEPKVERGFSVIGELNPFHINPGGDPVVAVEHEFRNESIATLG
jgi:hypothetical protein